MAFVPSASLPLMRTTGAALCTCPRPYPPRRRRQQPPRCAAAPPSPDAADRVSDAVVEAAARAADAARGVTTHYFRSGHLGIEFKDDESPVTMADREAEAAIREVVKDAFPGHGFLGEEGGGQGVEDGGGEWMWVADPIDGTKSFLSGKATFGTLIAVLRNGRPVYGVIDQPITGERWCGGVGRPTTLNGEEARVRGGYPDVTRLEEAAAVLAGCICFATHPDMFVGIDAVAFQTLAKAVKHVMYGCDCYAFALLASGHTDLVVEADLKVWDFAALVPVVTGAGGNMTDWSGLPLDIYSDGRVVASADVNVHRMALSKLAAAVSTTFDGNEGDDEEEDDELPVDPGLGHVESMTGFGEGEVAALSGEYSVAVQLRSVNSRFCDVQYRGPRFLAPYEAEFTAGIKRALGRGKIVFTVNILSSADQTNPTGNPANGASAKVTSSGAPSERPAMGAPGAQGKLSLAVDEDAVRSARELLDQVAAVAGIPTAPSVSDMLTFSDIFVKRDPGQGAAEVVPVVKAAIANATEGLMSARRREGAILERDLLTRCAEIERVVAEIERRAPDRLDRELKRIQSRVGAVQSGIETGELEPGRLEQEIALIADRIDITEELVRLRSHSLLFKMSFLGVTEPIGQRLVFLLQEMHREATTIASKASDAAIAQLAVLVKQELEKIREQVQNLC